MTKGELIRLLHENKQPIDTKIQIYLQASNDDKSVVSIKLESLEYSKFNKAILIHGFYEEEE